MIFRLLFNLVVNLVRVVVAPLVLLRRRRACPKGSWVRLDVDGRLDEMQHPRRPFARPSRGLALERVRALVDALLVDASPAGLVVVVKSLNASAAQRTALRHELARLRAAGKPVVVYLPNGGASPELLIAAAASRIVLGAKTTLGPLGFRVGNIYSRRALDRLGVVPDVHAQGAYKTAGEGLVRDSMSEAQREQLGRIVDVLHNELVVELAQARGRDRDTTRAWLDRGLLAADDAVAIGLADATAYDDELAARLVASSEVADGPTEHRDARPFVGASRYLARRTARVFRALVERPRIAVIEMHGAIVEKPPAPMGSFCDSERACKLLAEVADDARVAAVILHLDSPGGGVTASDRIHHAVGLVAKKKPVIACFAGVSASGGYYIASAAHAIVAEPTTLTGSIGVVAARLVIGPLLDRLGLSPQVITRGAHADMLDISRPFSEDERRIFDAELERTYRDFVAIVAAGRKKLPEDILPLAGGRVWIGADALQLGLVDKLGGFAVAVEEAKTRLGALGRNADVTLVVPPRRPLTALPFGAQAAVDLVFRAGLGHLVTRAAVALATRDRVLLLSDIEG